MMSPMLYTYLHDSAVVKEEQKIPEGYQIRVPGHLPGLRDIRTLSFERLDDESARDTQAAVEAMRQYTGDPSLTTHDLREVCTKQDHPLHKQLMEADYLRSALQGLSQRRRNHTDLKLRTRLMECPALTDLHDFLTSNKPVAAMTAMFGIGLLHLLVKSSGEDERSRHIYSPRSIRLEYHNFMDQAAQSLREQRGLLPNTAIPRPATDLKDYCPLVPLTDSWTTGLCFAQLAAVHNKTNIINMIVPLEAPLVMSGFIYHYDFLRLCSDEEERNTGFHDLLKHLRRIHRQPLPPSNLDELFKLHDYHQSAAMYKPKSSRKKLDKALNDPSISLVQLLIDNEYRLLREWSDSVSSPIVSGNAFTLDNLSSTRHAITSQLDLAFVSSELFDSLSRCQVPTLIENNPFLDFASSRTRRVPVLSKSQASFRLSQMKELLMTLQTKMTTYCVVPSPRCFPMIVDPATDTAKLAIFNALEDFQREFGEADAAKVKALSENPSWTIMERFRAWPRIVEPVLIKFEKIAQDVESLCHFDIRPRPFTFPRIGLCFAQPGEEGKRLDDGELFEVILITS